MTLTDPKAFADAWVRAWNDHDVEAILAHFSEDVVFTSPIAVQVLAGSDGVLRGKAALREYWTRGLALIPDLRFEVVGVYTGTSVIVVNYRNQKGGLVCEVMVLRDGLVVEGHGTYLDAGTDDNPAGVAQLP